MFVSGSLTLHFQLHKPSIFEIPPLAVNFFVNFYDFVGACWCLLWYNIKKGGFTMYVNITGSANNKDVYIYQSYRKENGKTSSRIYRKLGKLNDLLARFDGDKGKMWPGLRRKLLRIQPPTTGKKKRSPLNSPLLRVSLWMRNAASMQVTSFYRKYVASSGSTTSAETYATVINSHTTCMPFSRI